MADITYCSNKDCLNTDCERHPFSLLDETARFVSIADFSGVCRDYIHQALIEVERNEQEGERWAVM